MPIISRTAESTNVAPAQFGRRWQHSFEEKDGLRGDRTPVGMSPLPKRFIKFIGNVFNIKSCH